MNNFSSFEKKIFSINEIFSSCVCVEDRYKKILELGSLLPAFDEHHKQASNLVEGCQSVMYVNVSFKEGKLYFTAFSEALISKGLAALLYLAYNEEPCEVILKKPPTFLKELEILPSLSPSRANGVASLFSKLQKSALKFLSTQNLISTID